MMISRIIAEGVNVAPSAVSNKIEIWRDIPGYEGRYQVSNFGRVISLFHQRILTPKRCGSGYQCISLSNSGVKKRFYIHRLVALCFLTKPKVGANEVNHKDFDRSNNRISNLEWVTREENCKHAYVNGRLDFRRPRRCDNKSGKQGVWAESGGYRATIGTRKERLNLGWFKELEAAIEARNAAERKLLIYGNA